MKGRNSSKDHPSSKARVPRERGRSPLSFFFPLPGGKGVRGMGYLKPSLISLYEREMMSFPHS